MLVGFVCFLCPGMFNALGGYVCVREGERVGDADLMQQNGRWWTGRWKRECKSPDGALHDLCSGGVFGRNVFELL
jgi:hypothetical protein